MSKSKWIVGLVSTAALFMSVNAGATTLEKLSFGDMVDTASACVMGRAVKTTVFERDGQVYTETRFRVNERAFGQTNNFINVITLGGQKNIGRLRGAEVTAGSPTFFTNQESLLLLKPTETGRRGRFDLVGFNQGQFNVIDGNIALPADVGGLLSVEDAFAKISAERSSSSSSDTVQ